MNRPLLREELIRDEGERLQAYRDSLGNWTIGVGHLLPRGEHEGEEWTHPRSRAVLEVDIDIAHSIAVAVFGPLVDLEDARQRALVNMCFNLGGRKIRGFVRFIAAVRERNWPMAAVEALNSKWATQVGERAMRLHDMMLLGDGA